MLRLLLVLVITVLAYHALDTAGFVYEDTHYQQGMTTDLTPTRNLPVWSYRLNTWLSGANPWGFHAVNLSVHLVNTLLVFVLASLIGAWPVLAAAIFAWHPLQVEAVAYVSARPDLLMTTGVLVALIALVKAKEHPLWLGLVGLACVLAIDAKASGIAVMGLLAWTLILQGSVSRERVAAAVCVIAGALIVAWPVAVSGLPWNVSDGLHYAGLQSVALVRYLALVVVPLGQRVDHDFLVPLWLSGLALLAVGCLGALIGRLRVRWPQLALPAGWTLLAVAPRFLIAPLYAPYDPSPMSEHHVYVAGIGIACSLAILAKEIVPHGSL